MPKFYIEPEKIYNFPSEISIVHYSDSILVIAPETANWIVVNNDNCLNIIDFLRQGRTIRETMVEFKDNMADVKTVITQLEAKDFCNKAVSSVTEEPRSLHLYTTNKCNLNCPHCYMFSGRKNEDELSTDEIFKLFQDFSNSGGHNVTLSGGEPTLRAICLAIKKVLTRWRNYVRRKFFLYAQRIFILCAHNFHAVRKEFFCFAHTILLRCRTNKSANG